MFEYRVLRKVFGPEREQVTGEWRSLHNEELYDLLVIKSKRLRMAGHVARMGDKRASYRVFVGTANGKRPLGRPKYRWEDNIKINLQEVGWGGVDWFDLAKDRDKWWAVVNAVTNLRVLENAGNSLTSRGTVNFSGGTEFHVQ